MWQSFSDGWHTVLLVASGPSLTDEQIAIARVARAAELCRIVVINDNWQKIPDADVLYACDDTWWNRYINDVRAGFTGGRCVTQNHKAAKQYGLCWIPSKREPGLTTDGLKIHMGGNGLHQGMNYAFILNKLQPQTQILIGADMKRGAKSKEHPQGKHHWFGDHPEKLGQGDPANWIAGFNTLAKDAKRRGLDVVNCTLDTALTCFRRADLAATLAQ